MSVENNFAARRAIQELKKAREWCGWAQQQHGATHSIHAIASIDIAIRALEQVAGVKACELEDLTSILSEDLPF